MATIAPRRPAWTLPADAAGHARCSSRWRSARSSRSPSLLRTRDFGVGLLDRRGPVGRDRRPADRRTSPARCARTARRRSTTCCCTSGSACSAARRPRRTRCRCVFAALPCRRRGGRCAACSARAPRWMRRAAGGHQPVPDAVRAGDADVRAGGAARDARVRRVRPRVRAQGTSRAVAARAGAGRSPSASRWRRCSTRTTGRCSSRSAAGSRGSRCSSPTRRRRGATLLRRRADRRSASRSCCTLPWLPTFVYQAPAHGRAVVQRARRSTTCWRCPAGCSARSRSSCCCSPAAPGWLALLDRGAAGMSPRGRAISRAARRSG